MHHHAQSYLVLMASLYMSRRSGFDCDMNCRRLLPAQHTCFDFVLCFLPGSQLFTCMGKFVCHCSHRFPLWLWAVGPYLEGFPLGRKGTQPLRTPQATVYFHWLRFNL
jgi:hypothetical protein